MENTSTVIQKVLKGGTSLGSFVLPLQLCHRAQDTTQCTKPSDPHSQVVIGAQILEGPIAFGMTWRLPASARGAWLALLGSVLVL